MDEKGWREAVKELARLSTAWRDSSKAAEWLHVPLPILREFMLSFGAGIEAETEKRVRAEIEKDVRIVFDEIKEAGEGE